MLQLKTGLVLSIALGLLAGPVMAEEAQVRKAFQARFPGMKLESVTRTPFAGVYEVVFDGQIVYTDQRLTYLMTGNLFDVRGTAERNLTRERNMQLTADLLVKSRDLAIRRVKGNGRRVLYTFEDPNCGYCKELQKELLRINDVTLYTFLLPIVSPPDSMEKSRAVWCARDRGRAWEELLAKGSVSNTSKTCDTTAIERSIQLAERLGVRGTPAVYLASGQQIGGYLAADKIEQALASAPPAR